MNRTLTIPCEEGASGFIKSRLTILNSIFQLTGREYDALLVLLTISDTDPVSDRERAADTLGMSVPVMNNLIKALCDKKAISRVSKHYTYHPLYQNINNLDMLTIVFDGNSKA